MSLSSPLNSFLLSFNEKRREENQENFTRKEGEEGEKATGRDESRDDEEKEENM